MALVIYLDSELASPISDLNPDEVKQAVSEGNDLEEVRELFIASNDNTRTYENIILTAVSDTDEAANFMEVDVTYSLDNTTYAQSITLPDGDYTSPITVYRKVYSPNVLDAFKDESIRHQIASEEYVI